MFGFVDKKCVACKKGTQPLSADEVRARSAEVAEWQVNAACTEISRRFNFVGRGSNYAQNLVLATLISEIIILENHHPRIVIEYNYVDVSFTTHAAKGLTENDFICAAKINAVVALNKATKLTALADAKKMVLTSSAPADGKTPAAQLKSSDLANATAAGITLVGNMGTPAGTNTAASPLPQPVVVSVTQSK